MPLASGGTVSRLSLSANLSGRPEVPTAMHLFRPCIAAGPRDCGHAQPLARSSYPVNSSIPALASLGTNAWSRAGQPAVLCRGGNSEAYSSFETGEDREDEGGREGPGDSGESSGVDRASSAAAAGDEGGSRASSTSGAIPSQQEASPSNARQAGPNSAGPLQKTSPEELWESLQPSVAYLAAEEQKVVRDALELAFWAHDGQKRKSGEPFIIHPVEVTRILAELEMDWESLVAGLLHDTVEDTDRITFGEIEAKYGPAVRRIVEGETKVSKLGKVPSHEYASKGELQGRSAGGEQGQGPGQEESKKKKADVKADDLRQMFLAMTEEVRVIIVKLADRLHNMRTLAHMPPHKQEHIARETLRVFAPLARLLGIYRIKAELEDLSFRYAYPKDYERVARRLERLQREQAGGMAEAQEKLEAALRQDQFLGLMTQGCRVEPCWKEPYSLFRKLLARECKLEELTGVGQLSVVLSLRPDQAAREPFVAQQVCYHVLGLVHSMWPPVPGSVKDYIATPKPNGYQSLHTTVLPVGSGALFPLEVQIRTQEMDRLAEWGITTQLAAAAAAAAAAASAAASKLASGAEEGGEAALRLAAAGAPSTVAPTLGIPIKSVEIGSATSAAGVAGMPQNGALIAGSPADSSEASLRDVAPDTAGGKAADSGPPGVPAAPLPPRKGAAGGAAQGEFAHRVSWLNAIREWQEEFVGNLSATEFVETVTGDLLGSRIFVFTPRGEVKNLPEGATVVDYAYSIHSDVGNQMYAAKVNGNFVPPTQALANADVVEVLTYPAHAASLKGYTTRQEWLGHVRTRSARHKLTKYLREKASEVTAQRVNAFAAYAGEESSSSSDEGEANVNTSSPLLDPSAPGATNGAVARDPAKLQAARRRTNGALRSASGMPALESWSVSEGRDTDRFQQQVEDGAAQSRGEGQEAAGQVEERPPNGASVAPEDLGAEPGNGAWAQRGPRAVGGPRAGALNGAWKSWKAGRFQPFMPAGVAARVLWEPRGAPEASRLGQQRGEIRNGNGAAVLQSVLEEFTQWQELTVGMWQRLSSTAEPVQWLAIHCYDRSGLLSESSKLLTESGLLILTHAGRTNQDKGVGVMLFEVQASSNSDLEKLLTGLMEVEGVIGYAMGCTLARQQKQWI